MDDDKIILEAEVNEECDRLRAMGCRVVLTNGCFDLLHPGHVHHLRMARREGDKLIVAVNDDASVRALKGPHRPVFTAEERAFMVSSLQCVTYAVVFSGIRCDAVLRAAKPDVYAKGGDYTLETLDPDERKALEDCGATIKFLPEIMFPDGEGAYSTTDVVKRIRGE